MRFLFASATATYSQIDTDEQSVIRSKYEWSKIRAEQFLII
jgi:hypothetical protein